MSDSQEKINDSLVASGENNSEIFPLVTGIEESTGQTRSSSSMSILFNVLKIEIPYIVMLCMAVSGVGLITFTKGPPGHYWRLLAVVYCALCIYIGWPRAQTRPERVSLVWTQILHWAAFLVAMSLIYSPAMRALVDVDASGLNLMVLLALGTFVAGVHAKAWQICVVGLILALFVPAMATIQRSSLFIMEATLGLIFISVSLWMAFKAQRRGREETA